MLCFTWFSHNYCEPNPPLPPIAIHCFAQPPLGETKEESLGWGHWPSLLRNSLPKAFKTPSAWHSYLSRNVNHCYTPRPHLLSSSTRGCWALGAAKTMHSHRKGVGIHLNSLQFSPVREHLPERGCLSLHPPPPILHLGFLQAVSIDRPRPGQL